MTSSTQPLRDLVEQRLGQRWSEFAQAHPNLAQAIDQTRLVESAVRSLRDDPAFIEAMRAADLDEVKLAAAARVFELVERWVGRFMPL